MALPWQGSGALWHKFALKSISWTMITTLTTINYSRVFFLSSFCCCCCCQWLLSCATYNPGTVTTTLVRREKILFSIHALMEFWMKIKKKNLFSLIKLSLLSSKIAFLKQLQYLCSSPSILWRTLFLPKKNILTLFIGLDWVGLHITHNTA